MLRLVEKLSSDDWMFGYKAARNNDVIRLSIQILTYGNTLIKLLVICY